MFQIAHLRALMEVHRTGSVTAAAASLNFTPSALSQQLTRLEHEAGAPMLERVGRGVRLTPEGQVLLRHATSVIEQLERAKAEVAAVRGEVAGTLTVASFQTLLLDLVPRTVRALAQRHPNLTVQLVHREVLPAVEGLRAHHVDLVLGEEFPGAPAAVVPGTHRENFLSDPLRLAVSAAQLRQYDGGRLADLEPHRWALDPERSPMGAWARAACREAGFEPESGYEVTDPLLQVQLARTGLSPTFLPGLIGPEHLAGVALLSLPGEPRRTLYSLARSGAAASSAIQAFREALASQAAHTLTPAAAGRLRA